MTSWCLERSDLELGVPKIPFLKGAKEPFWLKPSATKKEYTLHEIGKRQDRAVKLMSFTLEKDASNTLDNDEYLEELCGPRHKEIQLQSLTVHVEALRRKINRIENHRTHLAQAVNELAGRAVSFHAHFFRISQMLL